MPMTTPVAPKSALILLAVLLGGGSLPAQEPSRPAVAPALRPRNFDESKVAPYTLPDPLVLRNGQPVRDADTWFKHRRAELIDFYENELLGRVPERVPQVTWTVAETEAGALEGKALRKLIVGKIGDGAGALTVKMNLYLPADARGPVPVILHLTFFSDSARVPTEAENVAEKRPSWARPTELAPASDLIARGYGYAVLRYTDFQPDVPTSATGGVMAMSYAPGQSKPAPDEWGAVGVWAWGASRALDYLVTDRGVDASRVSLAGFSRLGKTALWAGARDARFAAIFAACSGEMGAALSHRDFGETIDDMAVRLPWWFAGNFQKYPGHWENLQVDGHTLIALNAPHPVFLTTGTLDSGADPLGQFLGAVAAGPVYRLLGKSDLGVTQMPPTETPVISGSLGFYYHTGPHIVLPVEWKVFMDFADLHLKSAK